MVLPAMQAHSGRTPDATPAASCSFSTTFTAYLVEIFSRARNARHHTTHRWIKAKVTRGMFEMPVGCSALGIVRAA